MYVWLIETAKNHRANRDCFNPAITFIASFVLSFFTVYGIAISDTGYVSKSWAWVAGWTLAGWVIAVAALALFDHLVGRKGIRSTLAAQGDQAARKTSTSRLPSVELTPKSVASTAAILCCAWGAWFIVNYPAGLDYWDTYYQISMCYPDATVWEIPSWETGSIVDASFSDHHPLFDTLLYGTFARTSDALTGSWNLGIFTFILLQGAATATSLSLAIAYTERLGASRRLRLALLSIFALVPFYPSFADALVKDTLNAWLFVLYFVAVLHIVSTQGAALRGRRFLVLLIILSLLLALTKKTGLYVVLGTTVFLLAAYRRQWRGLLLSAAMPAAVIWLVLPLLIFPALNVVPGGKQEMLAIPFQQTARLVVLHGDELEDWEREAIDKVLVYDTLPERYTPEKADSVKFLWNADATTGDLVEYAKVWIIEGVKHPKTYFDAWFATVAGFFSPVAEIDINSEANTDFEGRAWHLEVFDGAREAMLSAYDFLTDVPGIGLAFKIVPYTFWIPVACFVVLWRRGKQWLVAFAPVLVSIALLCVSPTVVSRYAASLIYVAPLLVAVMRCVAMHRKTVLTVTNNSA